MYFMRPYIPSGGWKKEGILQKVGPFGPFGTLGTLWTPWIPKGFHRTVSFQPDSLRIRSCFCHPQGTVRRSLETIGIRRNAMSFVCVRAVHLVSPRKNWILGKFQICIILVQGRKI